MSGDGRPADAAKVIDFFFGSLYASTAEPLGRGDATESRAVDDPDCLHGDTAWDDPQADELLAWAPDRPPVELHAQFAALASNPAADVGLPVRYLGHAPLRHYYWMFCSCWDGTWAIADFDSGRERSGVPGSGSLGVMGAAGHDGRKLLPCPTFRTFHRRWTSVWKYYLRIRKACKTVTIPPRRGRQLAGYGFGPQVARAHSKVDQKCAPPIFDRSLALCSVTHFHKASQHSQCTTCFELSRAMVHAKNGVAVRYRSAIALRQHYRDQYADRCLYWSLRHASRLKENVLVIISDAMDKAKFAWPRYPWAKTSKVH